MAFRSVLFVVLSAATLQVPVSMMIISSVLQNWIRIGLYFLSSSNEDFAHRVEVYAIGRRLSGIEKP